MRRPAKKSGLVLTVGIIATVFGAVGLLCGGCGLFGNVTKAAMGNGPLTDPFGMYANLDREVPYWVEIDVARSTAVLLLSVVLLVAGIGLIAQKNWGRWLAVFACFAMIVQQCIYAVYQFGWFMPAMEKWQQNNNLGGNSGAFSIGQSIGGTFATAVIILIPAILLVLLLLPATTAALNPPQRRVDDDDDGFDDRRRRPKPELDDPEFLDDDDRNRDD